MGALIDIDLFTTLDGVAQAPGGPDAGHRQRVRLWRLAGAAY